LKPQREKQRSRARSETREKPESRGSTAGGSTAHHHPKTDVVVDAGEIEATKRRTDVLFVTPIRSTPLYKGGTPLNTLRLNGFAFIATLLIAGIRILHVAASCPFPHIAA
jgi:hypothetical protein